MTTSSYKNFLLSMIVALCTASPAYANITYEINQVGANGSFVHGSITTNGALGTVTGTDILDWRLKLNDGATTMLLTGGAKANSLVYAGSVFLGSTTDLSFDFSGKDAVLFQYGSMGLGLNFWCLDSLTHACSGVASSSSWVTDGTNAAVVFQEGVVSIGRVTAVPEPSTYAMFLLGMAMLGVIKRRRESLAPLR